MTILLSSSAIAVDAPNGAVVATISGIADDGVTALPCVFSLIAQPASAPFAISGNQLITARPLSGADLGSDEIRIRAVPSTLDIRSTIQITVTAAVAGLTFVETIMGTPITSINLIAGGPSVHVTVYEQTTTTAIPPANITWQASSVVNVVADATGFNFSALPRSTAFSFTMTATDAAQTPAATGNLTIDIVLPAITGLTFTSP